MQRLIFAALIIFMPQVPEMANFILILVSLVVLAYTMTEKPWKDAEVNRLAIMNEFFFYMLLVLALVFSCVHSTDSIETEVLGWILISLVTFTILVNIVALLSKAYRHSKLVLIRQKAYRAFISSRTKVEPMVSKSSPEQSEEVVVKEADEEDQGIIAD